MVYMCDGPVAMLVAEIWEWIVSAQDNILFEVIMFNHIDFSRKKMFNHITCTLSFIFSHNSK